MKNNLLFLTMDKNGALSLEIDLDKGEYYFDDEHDKKRINKKNNNLIPYFIDKRLFDLIHDYLEESPLFEVGCFNPCISHILLDCYHKEENNKKIFPKEEIFQYIKSGMINLTENERSKVIKRISREKIEKANYFIGEDILNIFRMYIERKINNRLFADYSYLLAWVIGTNIDYYEDDNINYLIDDISYMFDGFSFAGDDTFAEETEITDPRCYAWIKYCSYYLDAYFGKEVKTETLIKNRYKVTLLSVYWDTYIYIIIDTKVKRFNYGHFNLYEYDFNPDYFYFFADKSAFYNQLTSLIIIDDEDNLYLHDKKLVITGI